MTDPAPRVAFLTGATGFLGANLLTALLTRTRLEVRCLVRAPDAAAADAALRRALEAQGLWQAEFADRVRTVVGDLAQRRLGMTDDAFRALGESVGAIYHSGAHLNLFAPYRVLEPTNVNGTREVLGLAALGAQTFHHISSLVVLGSCPATVPGDCEPFEPPSEPPDSGYARSKWAAERLVCEAAARGLSASIYRPGRITGHSRTGVCAQRDALSLIASGTIHLGIAPALDAVIHLTPVDVVSRAIVDLSSRREAAGRAFHLINPAAIAWHQLTEALTTLGYVRETISYEAWRDLLLSRQPAAADPLLDLVTVLVSRSQPLFSPRRRTVADGHVRSMLADLAYPTDHVALLARYASHLARTLSAPAG